MKTSLLGLFSGQGGRMGVGLTLQKQLKKLNKVYEITVFKTLDIRQWRTVIPDRWGTKVSLAYCLEGVSRPGAWSGKSGGAW